MKELFIHGSYLVGAVLFVLGIKRMSRVRTARRGNQLAAVGMLLAVIATVVSMASIGWPWVIAGLLVGGFAGSTFAKRVAMTDMPELVALFNGMGGAASTMVALSTFFRYRLETASALGATWPDGKSFVDGFYSSAGAAMAVTLALSIFIGTLTLTGSIIAFLKLSGKMPGKPIILPARHALNIGLVIAAIVLAFVGLWVVGGAVMTTTCIILLTVVAALLGILLVIPIGGADMPVVISLLNSYSGVAASMAGFVLLSQGAEGSLMLISSGALVGAAGLILTKLMCVAMNRSLLNVLAGGFGDSGGSSSEDNREYENIKSTSPEEVAMLLDGAGSVIVVPGYGLAVAQAQHILAELDDQLTQRGTEVRYAIHPVAGRMPGHMNVLLAEANISYEKLCDLDEINSEFKTCDVAIVVGANDVVNPAATNDPQSPIAGMPILNCHEARQVVVIKRSLSPGYAGIKNELFQYDNATMLFEDAKKAIQDMVKEVKDL